MCKALQPAQVMAFLDELFTAFDDLTSIFNVYKVETIGGELGMGWMPSLGGTP